LLLIEKILRDTYQAFPKLNIEIDPRDVISVIDPSIKPASNSPLLGNGVYIMLHELVSGELDIDRMDYLLRDSRECGVVYGIFDAGRILDGLCIYQDNVDKSLHVAISSSGLAAFEDYLRARQSMYLQVYFHKTSASAEAMMQHLAKRLGHWTLPANAEAYAEFDEYNIGPELRAAAKKHFGDIYELREFEKMLKDLLYSRRLWKLAFEATGPSEDPTIKERVSLIKDIIAKQALDHEYVSSLTSLTRFSPREHQERSANYLRVIVRDELGVPRVAPIEDYATVVADNQKDMIHRIYLQEKINEKGVNLLDLAKQKINETLRHRHTT